MYRRYVQKTGRFRSRLYALWLVILNFFITSVCLGTIVWAAARIIVHPITYVESLEIGDILAAVDLVYNFINPNTLC